MKILRKAAGITVLLILIFMVIALLQYKNEEEASNFPEQIAYFFDENWNTCQIHGSKLTGADLQNHDKVKYPAASSGASNLKRPKGRGI